MKKPARHLVCKRGHKEMVKNAQGKWVCRHCARDRNLIWTREDRRKKRQRKEPS